MKKLGLFIFLLALLAGCGQTENADNLYGENETMNGTTFISNNHDIDRAGATRDHTMDEQNPNFINFEGNRINNQQDINQARRAVAADGYRPGPVWINGNDMWVTAYREGRLSNQEKVDAEAFLHKKLIKALPRYDIEVKIQEDRN